MKRAVLVTNIPTPYRVPLFSHLSRLLGEEGVGFTVVFAAPGYAYRRWEIDPADVDFAVRVLGSRRIPLGAVERGVFSYAGLGRLLAELAPDVAVVGGFSPATYLVRRHCRRNGAPYLIWSGAVAGRENSWPRRLWRRHLAVDAAGFVSYGSAARDYLVGLGADPGRVTVALNTVDTGYFRRETDRVRRESAVSPDSVLCLGHLTAGKRIDLLLRGVARLAADGRRARTVVVGDGPERLALEALARKLGIAGHVSFEGFRQRHELPGYLARAACLAFPSAYDVWGLVLVEAAAAGVASLASIRAGATRDVVLDGTTGFALDFENTEGVAERIGWVLEHPAEAAAMGERAAGDAAGRLSIERSAGEFAAAVRRALEGGGR